MTQWEYYRESVRYTDIDGHLEKLGERGWELVSIQDRGGDAVQVVLKRPKGWLRGR